VSVDLDVASEVAIHGFVSIAGIVEERVALAVGRNSEVRQLDIDNEDFLGLPGSEA
jgi:hypothetical protein